MSTVHAKLLLAGVACLLLTRQAHASYLDQYSSPLTAADGNWAVSLGTVAPTYTSGGLRLAPGSSGGEYSFLPAIAGNFTATVHIAVPTGSNDTSYLIVRYAPVYPSDSRVALGFSGGNSVTVDGANVGSYSSQTLANAGSLAGGFDNGTLEVVDLSGQISTYFESDSATSFSLVGTFSGVPGNAPQLAFAQYGSSSSVFSNFTLLSNDAIGTAVPEPSSVALLIAGMLSLAAGKLIWPRWKQARPLNDGGRCCRI